MKKFIPDYQNIVDAAMNCEPKRIPLYEHNVSFSLICNEYGKTYNELSTDEFFKIYTDFFLKNGYDAVTFEGCITKILPGGGALGRHVDPVIKTREDFKQYPWEKLAELYRKEFVSRFDALRKHMPEGMKAIGGVGNGPFELAQDLVGYENLMLMIYDDEDLFFDLFRKIGDLMAEIWEWFLSEYSDLYCVVRYGDDLGFKSNTLMPHDYIRQAVLPQMKRIVDLAHGAGKPFLLHSCGCIFDVFEDIIQTGINAKHSNEDQIAKFTVWVDRYGDQIGNFGGLDTDDIVRCEEGELKKRIVTILDYCSHGKGGIAFGTGNSIPDYADFKKYHYMIDTVRDYRGDFR